MSKIHRSSSSDALVAIGPSRFDEIGHSYFWNNPLRGAGDALSMRYLIDGLQSIDITLETLPANEGYRQAAMTYIDHLMKTSVAAVRSGNLLSPPGLEQRLEEFSVAWRLIALRRDAVLRQAAAIADLAVDLRPGKGASMAKGKRFVATHPAAIFMLQLLPVAAVLAWSFVSSSTGILVAILLVWLLLDLGFKLSVGSTFRQAEDNQEAFDAFSGRIARLVSSNLTLSQFANNDDDGPDKVPADGEEFSHELGQMFTQPPYLLPSEDAIQRKGSIDAMLGEADDDEGCVTLRVKGFPNVSVSLSALSAHLLIVVTDLEGKVAYWNDGATTVTGFSSHDAEGMKISSFLFGDNASAVYANMVEAAVRQGEQSAKPLTLANATYGHVTVKASVTPVVDASKEAVGYVLVASQQGERSMKQNMFHQYFLGELALELKRAFYEFVKSDDLGRCGHLLEAMGWNNLRDLASAANNWRAVMVQGLLNEALRDRHRQVDVKMSPTVPDQILCDQLAVSRTVARTLGLLQGKLRLTISHHEGLPSNLVSRLCITAGPASYVTESNLRDIVDLAATVGGEAIFSSKQEIQLTFPYLAEGASNNLLADQDQVTTKASMPVTILLFEKNAVYRHNISAIAFAGGHSVRIVENVADALRALSEGALQFGCAMVDVDTRDIAQLTNALKAATVYLIEMTEQVIPEPLEAGRVLLAKPVPRAEVEVQLALAAESVSIRKREEDRITKQRAILSTQRNSPWVKGRKLGHGAFANVFEATSTLTGGKMAVKMIRLRRGKDEEEKAKTLLNEIEILCQLQHPNIIHYFYCEPAEETLNLFMELATGGSLQDLLQKDSVLSEVRVAFITKELLLAVRYLHDQEIIHRDIKPGNILLSGAENEQVKLTDFGTATQETASDTQGTIEYMAPEVLDGVTYKKECDIWSVGCVVCKCLGIDRPKRNDTLYGGQGVPTSFPPHISQVAREFINLCLQDEPSERAVAGSLLLHDFIVNVVSLPRDGVGVTEDLDRRGSVMSVWTDEGAPQAPTIVPKDGSIEEDDGGPLSIASTE